jgi:outer membrane protein W
MKKLLSIVLLFISIVTYSQVEKGDKEIGVFGNFNAPTEGGGASGAVSVSLNRYVTPNFSFGLSIMMSFYSAPSASDPTGDNEIKMTPFMGFFATYNFLTANGKVLPYLGAEYSFSWIETVETETIPTPPYLYTIELLEDLHFLGGKAGLKIFMTEMVNFDINLKYQTLISGPEGYTAGNFGVNFGVGIILPRKQ